MVTHYYSRKQTLLILRVEHIVEFLRSGCPDHGDRRPGTPLVARLAARVGNSVA
jgi:hypothetical protein